MPRPTHLRIIAAFSNCEVIGGTGRSSRSSDTVKRKKKGKRQTAHRHIRDTHALTVCIGVVVVVIVDGVVAAVVVATI